MQTNPLLMQAVSSILIKAGNIDLIEGRASSITEMLDEVAQTKPDILLLDNSFPYSGDSLPARLLAIHPNLPVIVVSDKENLIYVVRQETVRLETSHDLIAAIHQI